MKKRISLLFHVMPSIIGIRIVYDLRKPQGERVTRFRVLCSDCVVPQYEDVDVDRVYKVVTSSYLLGGGDGFATLAENYKLVETGKIIRQALCFELPLIMRNHF